MSNRVQTKLLMGNSLQLGGPTYGYGQALTATLFDSTPGLFDALLDVRGDILCSGDITVTGTVFASSVVAPCLVVQDHGVGTAQMLALDFEGPGASISYVGTKAVIRVSGGTAFSGDVTSTAHGYLSGTLSTDPVIVRSDAGVQLEDTSATKGLLLRTMSVQTAGGVPDNLRLGGGSLPTVPLNSTTGWTVFLVARGVAGVNIGKSLFYQIYIAGTNTAGVGSQLGSSSPLEMFNEMDWLVDATVDGAGQLNIGVLGDAGTTIDWRASLQEVSVP